MPDLDFSAFNITPEELAKVNPNDLKILKDPIPMPPDLEPKPETPPVSHPDKFLFTAEEFLAGIVPDKK